MKKIYFTNYLYVLPAILFIVFFVLYPILYNFFNSFFEWQSLRQDTIIYVGLKNFINLVKDPVTLIILKNTVIFFVITVVVQLGLALILAYLFSGFMGKIKGSNLMKTIVFTPVTANYVVVGIAFLRLLDMSFGDINLIIRAIGLDNIININWLGNPTAALYTLIFISIWKWTGYSMVIYFAGLMAIPQELKEAALIDGANNRGIFVRVIFPSLRSTHYTVLILNLIGVFKTFDHVQAITQGGPGRATQFFSTYIYLNATQLFKQGYASAYAVILFILTLAATIFALRMYNKGLNQ